MTRERRPSVALPVLAGVILALAHPPARLLLPAFVGLVPLLVFIGERPPGPAGRWDATRAGLVTGALYFGIQLYWLAVALVRYSALAIPAYLGAVLVLTAFTGAFAWAVHTTRERLRLPIALLAPLFWTLLEWTQGHLGDLAFPWLGLGAALAPFPTLAGAADLVGSRGLTVWVAAINGILAAALLRFRAGRPVRATLAAGLLAFAIPAAYGAARAASLEPRPVARVAVVQPNIPEDVKLDPRIALDSSLAALTRLTRTLEAEPLDLVVWPEVALPVDLARDTLLRRRVRAMSRMLDAPIVVGAYGVDHRDDDVTAFNSAFLIDAAGPAGAGARYDKRRLVPFVERVPFIDPGLLEPWMTELRYFGALEHGREKPVLMTRGGARFGVLICYESIFDDLSREYRRAGADFLVNITNDAWYGRETWWGRTAALWQHPAHMVLRAIETRTGVARAANTGISMFVDPLGRTYERTPLFQPAVRVATVFTTDQTTLSVRWGDWLATLAALAAAMALLAAARTRSQDGHSMD
ncbi:MAG: apolipoprotein N-acyltransferase [Gemmatimonadota bacterium]